MGKPIGIDGVRWEWGRIKSAEQRKEPMFQDVSTADGPRGITWNHGIREIPATFTWPELIHEHQFEFDDSPNMKFGYFMVIISNHVKHRETKNRSAKFRCDHFVAILSFCCFDRYSTAEIRASGLPIPRDPSSHQHQCEESVKGSLTLLDQPLLLVETATRGHPLNQKNRFTIGSPLVHHWFTIGSPLVHHWFTIGSP